MAADGTIGYDPVVAAAAAPVLASVTLVMVLPLTNPSDVNSVPAKVNTSP